MTRWKRRKRLAILSIARKQAKANKLAKRAKKNVLPLSRKGRLSRDALQASREDSVWESRQQDVACYDAYGAPKTCSHSYGDVHAAGDARLHLGDTVTHITVHKYYLSTSRPWKYTVHELFPKVYSYHGWQFEDTRQFKTINYQMLVTLNLDQCVRVLVSLVLSPDDKAWQILNHDGLTRSTVLAPPRSLLIKMYDMINEGNLSEDFRVAFSMSSDQILRAPRIGVKSRAEVRYDVQELTQTLRRLTDDPCFRNFAHYREDELDYRLLLPGYQSSRLLAYVRGKLVHVTRFGPNQQLSANDIHSMMVLRTLNGRMGFVRFRGVVHDDKGVISAFLNDLPPRGTVANAFSDAIKLGTKISRTRRLRWCQQLVQAVANAHAGGLALGLPGMSREPPLGLDSSDNILLYRNFRTYFHPETYLPPEYEASEGPMLATPETDIYQLGLALWRIAGHIFRTTRSALCEAVSCNMSQRGLCSDPHTRGITLPMMGDDYPGYIREIIKKCRNVNPLKRPSAAALLAMFPSHDETSPIDLYQSIPQPDVESYRRLLTFGYTCDHDGTPCDNHYFHCSICHFSNFDICPQCFFEKGLHCKDDRHYLREYKADSPGDKYYSSVMSDGKREMHDLSEMDLRKLS